MSSKTTNYNLHKIDLTDAPPDITVLNQNWDTLDSQLKSTQETAEEALEAASNVSGVKVVKYVVGTSTAGWTTNDCDYLCDGTSDEVEINQALSALPSTGGEVVLLDGTYNLSARITVGKKYTTFRGNGAATKLVRGFNGDSSNAGMIYIFDGHCTVKDMYLDGQRDTYNTDYSNRGVYIGTSNNVITGLILENHNNVGILVSANYNKIHNNKFLNNDTGIDVSDDYNIVTENTFTNNNVGIYVYYCDHNTIVGNISRINTTANLDMYRACYNIITGNIFSVLSDDSTVPTYAIRIRNDESVGNIIDNNQLGEGSIYTEYNGSANTLTPPSVTFTTYGTNDLTAGTSQLGTGALYFVYE